MINILIFLVLATRGDSMEQALSSAKKIVSSGDGSCRPKIRSKPDQESLLSEMAGLSLSHKPSIKYNFAKRPNYGIKGKHIEIFVNYFMLNFKDTTIYHYDVDISEVTKDNKMGRSLMSEGKTAKEDAAKDVKHVERQKRRNIGKAKCRQIIAEMVKSKSLQQFCPVYDGQKNLYTCKQLPYKEKMSFPVEFHLNGELKKFFITIQPVKKDNGTNIISLEPLINIYNKKSTEIPQEILLVYETILNHREPPFEQVQFRNSFFSLERENVMDLDCGMEIWFGYHQSVHLTELGPVVIINLAAKAFHKAGPVIDYAKEVLRSDITRRNIEKWQIEKLSKALKGLQITVNHQKQPRKYKIKGLTHESAEKLTLQFKGEKLSIAEYFHRQYKRRLHYPHLPCLHMQTSNNTTYIPMETCEIVKGQPKIGKLTPDLSSRMIRSTAIPPRERFNYINADAKKVKGISKNYMDAFGLIMDVTLLKVGGRIMAAPQLAYGGNADDNSRIAKPDNRGVWRVEDGKKFFKVVNVKKWVLISFADDRQVGNRVLDRYCEFLVKSARKCGMQLDRPIAIDIYGRNVTTDKALLNAKNSGAEFAIIILNRNDHFHTYDEVKFLADFKHGLVTQCMEDKTLQRINDQITTNVCLKINVKLGGINHILLHRPQVFSKPVIVIGADAIHWPRGYGYPSIVAVVGSLNPTASRYALTCDLQKNDKQSKMSQEIIKDMNKIAGEILEIFCKTNQNIPPHKIIVYRDGVSEGQFQHALEYEVSGIQAASKRLFNAVIPITYIVVQKRHQTRFRPVNPAEGAGKQQNVPPGTTVDKTISHPVFFDYFIASHEGIQGTSKPAHYTVLHDDNKFQADDLQQLSHFLCHIYVRCTRSVSLPAPVLYADLAAARAKKYADLHIHEDTLSTTGSEDIQRDLPRNVEQAIKSMKSFEKNMFYI